MRFLTTHLLDVAVATDVLVRLFSDAHADSSTDASFDAAVAGGIEPIDENAAGHYSTGGFNPASYPNRGGLSVVAGQDGATSQSLGDPMDLDFDFDAALWASDWGPATNLNHLEPHMDLDYSRPMAGMPGDFLFAEDEGVLPAASSCSGQPSNTPVVPSPTRTVFSVTRSDPGSDDAKSSLDDGSQNGLARQRLRRQLSLLSKGWAGDEIRFKNCDPSKAVVLHTLAMELGLAYNHDVMSREVLMSRLEPPRAASKPQRSPHRLSSSLSRSSTELDSTLCLPGLPSVPEYRGFEFASNLNHEPSTQTAHAVQAAAAAAAVAKNQPLARRPSRGERISDSISKHVSTLSSIAKGGRRGPLSEKGRLEMRALEAAGGACWRCKVLRRKVSQPSRPSHQALEIAELIYFKSAIQAALVGAVCRASRCHTSGKTHPFGRSSVAAAAL